MSEFFKAGDFDDCGNWLKHPSEVASKANRILEERSRRVYGSPVESPEKSTVPYEPNRFDNEGVEHTHTALLVDIRPLENDSAESLLREYLRAYDDPQDFYKGGYAWVSRVRALLKNKSEE